MTIVYQVRSSCLWWNHTNVTC